MSLYEKTDSLGGLLKTSEYPSFKWPHRDFKAYLIRQIEKAAVRVCLNTKATPEMLIKEEYDAVMAAIGAEPIIPDIPGIKGKNVLFAQDVFGNEDTLAEKVVIIGGGETGVETGMHLAELGHKVTVLEKGDALAPQSVPIHYYSMLQQAWENLENFNYILEACYADIDTDKVTYEDASGEKNTLEAGSIVIAAGTKAKHEKSMGFYGSDDHFYMIGDCNIAGNIQTTMRSAFSIASMI